MSTVFRRSAFPLASAVFALLLKTLSASGSTAADWEIGIVDAGIGGQFSSLRLDTWGNGHVAYVDANDGYLKYGFWDHQLNKWFTATIDRSRGFCSLVLDSDQHPHISYLDYGNNQLKYAHWTGSAWEKQVIPIRAHNISFYTSVALVEGNRPSITYYEYEDANGDQELHLRDVTLNNGQWQLRTVDPTPGSGKFNSIASDSQGNLQVAYSNVRAEDESLRYASFDGHTWAVQIIDQIRDVGGHPITPMWSTALVIDKADQPHIAYTDVLKRLVKYAVKVNGKWNIEVVDAIRKESYPDRNGLALDETGTPYISYYDAGAGLLKLAHKAGGHWVTEIVDGNFAGYTSSLQIHDGAIWITYADETRKDLKFARRRLEKTVPVLEQSSKVTQDSSRAQ
jgi:hypothetical protein